MMLRVFQEVPLPREAGAVVRASGFEEILLDVRIPWFVDV